MESINKYQNGKIYKIISKEMPGLVYYGSTIQTLKQRMTKHMNSSNTSCSKALFAYGTPEIILIEDYPCYSRKELEIEEGKYHRGNECINKNVAGRTDKEYREDNKEKQRFIILIIRKKYRKKKKKNMIANVVVNIVILIKQDILRPRNINHLFHLKSYN